MKKHRNAPEKPPIICPVWLRRRCPLYSFGNVEDVHFIRIIDVEDVHFNVEDVHFIMFRISCNPLHNKLLHGSFN